MRDHFQSKLNFLKCAVTIGITTVRVDLFIYPYAFWAQVASFRKVYTLKNIVGCRARSSLNQYRAHAVKLRLKTSWYNMLKNLHCPILKKCKGSSFY